MASLTLTMTVPSGESWRLLDALRLVMVPVRAQAGCAGCEVALAAEATDPSRIRYREDWRTDEDLRRRIRSEHFVRLMAVMERALERPRLRFELAGGSRELDYVVEVRDARE